MMISCLYSFLLTVLHTPSAEPLVNKKRTRTLFHKESGSGTNWRGGHPPHPPTQHFLTGDRFGIIREVEIEYDPVIKDVDRVDKGINDLPLVLRAAHVTLAEFFKPEPNPLTGQDGLFSALLPECWCSGLLSGLPARPTAAW